MVLQKGKNIDKGKYINLSSFLLNVLFLGTKYVLINSLLNIAATIAFIII